MANMCRRYTDSARPASRQVGNARKGAATAMAWTPKNGMDFSHWGRSRSFGRRFTWAPSGKARDAHGSIGAVSPAGHGGWDRARPSRYRGPEPEATPCHGAVGA